MGVLVDFLFCIGGFIIFFVVWSFFRLFVRSFICSFGLVEVLFGGGGYEVVFDVEDDEGVVVVGGFLF